jgi:hypothetical protein
MGIIDISSPTYSFTAALTKRSSAFFHSYFSIAHSSQRLFQKSRLNQTGPKQQTKCASFCNYTPGRCKHPSIKNASGSYFIDPETDPNYPIYFDWFLGRPKPAEPKTTNNVPHKQYTPIGHQSHRLVGLG